MASGASGSQIVEKGDTKKLRALNRRFENFFMTSTISVHGSSYVVAHCEFVYNVYERRDVSMSDKIVKLGIDRGVAG